MEIERKFLVRQVPGQLSDYKKKEIEQGYLSRNPVLRIRKSNEHYILTYKMKAAVPDSTALLNNEIEAVLSEEAYLHLRDKVDNHVITKTRYLIPLGNHSCIGADGYAETYTLTGELDVFHGILEGLVFIEVEFPSVAAADSFTAPEWFGEDVSDDRRYRNGYLSELNSLNEF